MGSLLPIVWGQGGRGQTPPREAIMRSLPILRQEGCHRYPRAISLRSDVVVDSAAQTLRPLGTMVAYGFERGSVQVDLDVAERLHATVLEILPDWQRFPDPREMRKVAEERGFTIWSAHGCWGGQSIRARRVDLGSLSQETWQESVDDLKRCLDWLQAAGGCCLVVHPGGLSDREDQDRRRDALIRGLHELADHVHSIGLMLCVENMPPGVHPGSRMSDLTKIVADVDRTAVRLALDTGHANLGSSLENETLAAEGFLETTHVHDNDGRADSHLPPGEGTIVWSEFGNSLRTIGYRGPIMLECIRELRRRPENINDTFLALLQQLRGGV